MAIEADSVLDCTGTYCPIPIARTAQAIKDIEVGQVLEVVATDTGIKADMPAWCHRTGHEFLGLEEEDGEYHAFVRRSK
ncbi:MAG: sulfurtransferase TusA family protein [Dehalococcoidales bacterium]|nr:sulfurtransferase TusA family protein [Dehalococcoidales bacterium]